jgi:hypothetical protein
MKVSSVVGVEKFQTHWYDRITTCEAQSFLRKTEFCSHVLKNTRIPEWAN